MNNPFRPHFKTAQRVVYQLTSPLRAQRSKVFGIGLSRTGTKSLNNALRLLGYRSDHFSTHLLDWRDGAMVLNLEAAAAYDALTDVTASCFYRELDERFAGAKFILTTRNIDDWLRSCMRHFDDDGANGGRRVPPKLLRLRTWLYQTPTFDPSRFQAIYERHADQVRTYFSGRPDDLLELDICAGQHWAPLCTFLGAPIPAQSFPWSNQRR